MLNALRLFTIIIPAGISPMGESQTAMDVEMVGNIVHVSVAIYEITVDEKGRVFVLLFLSGYVEYCR